MRARDVLNMLKWKKGFDFNKVEVWYVNRGAPGDVSVIKGGDIEKVGRSFIYTKGKAIPFHRVIRISYEGKDVFRRFDNGFQDL